jgi:signal transduction histidine kinase
VGVKYSRYLIGVAVLFFAYFLTARFGLTLNAVSHFATLVWAPTGIALAALLLLGYRFWPAITLAAFLVNFTSGATPVVAFGISIGNTLEALLGAYLLKRVIHFDSKMERVRDVLGLFLLAAVLSTTVSATVGVSSLWLGHTISMAAYGATWMAWWVGDMLGAAVVAPFLLVWSRHLRFTVRLRRIIEISAYVLSLVAISALIFRGLPSLGIQPYTFIYAVFPLMIWVALRFGQVGSVTTTLVVSGAAVWGTVTSSHTSAGLSHRLLILQTFMGITAATFMIMAAVVAERERTQRQEELLAQKAEFLTQQRARLLALNKAKDEFISLASHQLRTPATIVKVYTGMLLGNYSEELTDDQKNLLKTAYDNNEQQLALVDSMLRVARLDTGKIVLKKEKVDLAQLVEEVIGSYNGNFAARQQTVRFQHGKQQYVTHADKEKVRKVLETIIDNASKYSPAGKKIDIRIKRREHSLAVAVQDNGIGIVKKDIKKLYKKFSRIENPLSTSVNGTGLGLYWAKKVVDLHHGSIEVVSTPNKGSTFTLILPDGSNLGAR